MPELGTPEGEFYNPDPVATDDSVDIAAAVAAGAGQPAQQQVTDASTSSAVYQPQRQNISQSVNIQGGFPQQGVLELTQEDFYPGPGVAEDRYETGLELTPRAAQTPLGAISKAAALLQRRQQDLDKAVQDFDINSKMGKAADPYQQNFVKVARGKMDNFVAGVADAYYKGDKKAAMRAIATNPELRTKWRQLSSELEALGQHSQFIGLRAAEYIKNAKDNKIQFDPETLKMAEELYFGLNQFSAEDGAGGDVLKQTRLNRAFEQRMSMEEFYNNDVLKGLEQSQQELSKVGITKRGNTWFMTKEGKKNFDGVIDAMAPRMADVSGITVEEAKDYLTKRLPVSITEDVHAQGIEMGRGSDSASGVTISGSNSVVPMAAEQSAQASTVDNIRNVEAEKELARKGMYDMKASPEERAKAQADFSRLAKESNNLLAQRQYISNQEKAAQKHGGVQAVTAGVVSGNKVQPMNMHRWGNDQLINERFERVYDPNGNPTNNWYVVGNVVGGKLTKEKMDMLAAAANNPEFSSMIASEFPIMYKPVSVHQSDADAQYSKFTGGKSLLNYLNEKFPMQGQAAPAAPTAAPVRKRWNPVTQSLE